MRKIGNLLYVSRTNSAIIVETDDVSSEAEALARVLNAENERMGFYDDVIDTDIPKHRLRAMAEKNLSGVILYNGRVIHAGRKCDVSFKTAENTLYITVYKGNLEVNTDTCEDDREAMEFAVAVELIEHQHYKLLPSYTDDWEFNEWADELEHDLGKCQGLVIFNDSVLYHVNGLKFNDIGWY